MRQIISIVNWCATPRECDWQSARCAQPSHLRRAGRRQKSAADGFPVNRAAARDHPRFVGTDRVFLTAEWQHLAMLNYEVDASLLSSVRSCGTELDLWNGKVFVSLVGFRFLKTRLLGVLPFPATRILMR